jgi:hypothetical protein
MTHFKLIKIKYISLPCGIQYTNLIPIATGSYLYIITTTNEGRVRCSFPLTNPQSSGCLLCENRRPAPIGRQAERMIQMRALGDTHLPATGVCKCQIFIFLISFFVMSPSVGLTFPFCYTFYL